LLAAAAAAAATESATTRRANQSSTDKAPLTLAYLLGTLFGRLAFFASQMACACAGDD
jgi:hypothetical protein